MIWLLTLLACTTPSAEPPAAPQAPAAEAPAHTNPELAVDLNDPAACAACHGAVVEEWNTSMHSRAHQDHDPIFGAMRELRMAKQGEQIAGKCAQCHNPRSPADTSTPAAKAGVSCATCHNVAALDPSKGPGAKALTYDTNGVLTGPHDLEPGASPVHGTGPAAAHLTDGTTMCLACHNATKTPAGEPACTTGPEHASVDGAASCTSCHMPRVEGPSGTVSTRADHASHAFLGPHHAWYHDDASMLNQALELSVGLDGTTATATLVNTSQHAMPTGFPGRMAIVVATGTNAQGEVIWKNHDTNPMADDPQSVLFKVYVDDEGTPTPAPFATKLLKDTRLTPGETRTLTWTVPEGVTQVDLTVAYRLLPPPLAQKFGLTEAVEGQPRPMAKASSAAE